METVQQFFSELCVDFRQAVTASQEQKEQAEKLMTTVALRAMGVAIAVFAGYCLLQAVASAAQNSATGLFLWGLSAAANAIFAHDCIILGQNIKTLLSNSLTSMVTLVGQVIKDIFTTVTSETKPTHPILKGMILAPLFQR